MDKPKDYKERIDEVDEFLRDNWRPELPKSRPSKIKLSKISGGIVASLSEEGLCNSTELRKSILRLADEKENDFIVLDLAPCKIIPSSSLALLIRLLKRCRDDNKGFALARLHPAMKGIMEVTGIGKVFDIFGDTDQAVAYFVSMAGKDT